MYTVYILRDGDGKFYKGVTSNLEKRLEGHKRGNTRTTSMMKDLVVVYTESYEQFANARKRELYLKSAAGRRFLKKILSGPR
jgi:putative endonuclease